MSLSGTGAASRFGLSVVAAFLVVLAGACESAPGATVPSPSIPPSSIPPVFAEYRVSGVVTFEDGSPAVNAEIGLSYALGAHFIHRTSADADGRYEFRVSPPAPSFIVANHPDGYDTINQQIGWKEQSAVSQDLRLRRLVTVNAGESTVISFTPDGSLCNWEFGSTNSMLCEWLTVVPGAAGMLTVGASPVNPGDPLPLVGMDNRGEASTVSVQVRSANAGARYPFNLAIPVGSAPRQFVVTTSLRQ